MTEEEKWARIKELQGVIGKAEAELKTLIKGAVILRSDAFTIATGVGRIEYDTDDMVWHFAGR